MLTWLQRDSLDFPPLNKALREPNGLLAAGGDLRPERLIKTHLIATLAQYLGQAARDMQLIWQQNRTWVG